MSDDADKATSLKHAAGSESDAWNTYIGSHALAAISPYAGGSNARLPRCLDGLLQVRLGCQ